MITTDQHPVAQLCTVSKIKMGRLIASVFVTIDGMVADSRNEIIWALRAYNEEMSKEIEREQEQTGMMIFGRKTYQILSDYWADYSNDTSIRRLMLDTEKVVFSTTLTDVSWKNTTVISRITRQVVLELKRSTDRMITVIGSPMVLQQLTNLGLIDEYRLFLFPVVLGSGKPLFSRSITRSRDFQLTSARILQSGVIALRYRTLTMESGSMNSTLIKENI